MSKYLDQAGVSRLWGKVKALVASLGAVLNYKGTVADLTALNAITGMKAGDVYHVTANSGEYAYDGSAWQELGSVLDLSGAITITPDYTNSGSPRTKIGTINVQGVSHDLYIPCEVGAQVNVIESVAVTDGTNTVTGTVANKVATIDISSLALTAAEIDAICV